MNTGWICPKCGRVFAPTWYTCSYCNGPPQTVTTTTTEVKPEPKPEPRQWFIRTREDGSAYVTSTPVPALGEEVVKVVEVIK